MLSKKKEEIKTLIVRLGALSAIVIGVFIVVRMVRSGTSKTGAEIDDTPIRVEQIKAILELNTIRFRDEVVVDSVELYHDSKEHSLGNLEKLTDFNTMDEFFKGSQIKRRLTLIVKGDLLYGVNLKTSDFDLQNIGDTLVVHLPEPELLSATVNPSNTDVFAETGIWRDSERRNMMIKARKKMIRNGEDLHLALKAREPLEKTIRQLVHTDKPIKIDFVN